MHLIVRIILSFLISFQLAAFSVIGFKAILPDNYWLQSMESMLIVMVIYFACAFKWLNFDL